MIEQQFSYSEENKLTRDELVVKTIQADLTLSEIKKILLNKSPEYLFVTPYSTKKPFWYITRKITENGVYMYCDAIVDKREKFYDWNVFYSELKKVGLKYIKF